MALPNLNAAQVGWIIQQTEAYIAAQRAIYRPDGVALTLAQATTMSPFFPQLAINSTRLRTLVGTHVANPPFYGQLISWGFPPALLLNFAQMAAITFVDTVVFQVPYADWILFHELVHVVQYQKLGLPTFAAKYITGFLSGGCYENIPLERNARELEERFSAAPANPFAVADVVQAWIDEGRF